MSDLGSTLADVQASQPLSNSIINTPSVTTDLGCQKFYYQNSIIRARHQNWFQFLRGDQQGSRGRSRSRGRVAALNLAAATQILSLHLLCFAQRIE